MSEIIVEVVGGNVVGVYSDDAELSIKVLDWDNLSEEQSNVGFQYPRNTLTDLPPETRGLLFP